MNPLDSDKDGTDKEAELNEEDEDDTDEELEPDEFDRDENTSPVEYKPRVEKPDCVSPVGFIVSGMLVRDGYFEVIVFDINLLHYRTFKCTQSLTEAKSLVELAKIRYTGNMNVMELPANVH